MRKIGLIMLAMAILAITVSTNDIQIAKDNLEKSYYLSELNYVGNGEVELYHGLYEISGDFKISDIRKIGKLKGVSITYSADLAEFENLIKELRVKTRKYQYLDSGISVLGCVDYIKGGVETSNGYVNIQISFAQGVITIGTPVILGSY